MPEGLATDTKHPTPDALRSLLGVLDFILDCFLLCLLGTELQTQFHDMSRPCGFEGFCTGILLRAGILLAWLWALGYGRHVPDLHLPSFRRLDDQSHVATARLAKTPRSFVHGCLSLAIVLAPICAWVESEKEGN
ncbi:hypothetical protein J3458_000050 [Metarhizium acridum]|uniref:uncharacterized protein n=1 Tax=Metarhizium acridum TaxID=92637 RepID=UPI001C6CDC4D|nr:hypothetical protein J3458_000050 [Metarhizium acridum]